MGQCPRFEIISHVWSCGFTATEMCQYVGMPPPTSLHKKNLCYCCMKTKGRIKSDYVMCAYKLYNNCNTLIHCYLHLLNVDSQLWPDPDKFGITLEYQTSLVKSSHSLAKKNLETKSDLDVSIAQNQLKKYLLFYWIKSKKGEWMKIIQ